MAFVPITLRGKFTRPDGTPAIGRVSARLSSALQDPATDEIRTRDTLTATLEKATWDGLSPAQRQETTRLGLLAVAKIARLILGRLDSA